MDAIYFISAISAIGYGPVAIRAAYVALIRKFRHYNYSPKRTGLIHCSK